MHARTCNALCWKPVPEYSEDPIDAEKFFQKTPNPDELLDANKVASPEYEKAPLVATPILVNEP